MQLVALIYRSGQLQLQFLILGTYFGLYPMISKWYAVEREKIEALLSLPPPPKVFYWRAVASKAREP